MKPDSLLLSGRRNFIRKSTAMATSAGGLLMMPLAGQTNPSTTTADNINIIGPKEGYTPQIGTMVSMMNWMRTTILEVVSELTTKELDYLHDEQSNTIGAMLLHLAATERFYQLHTLDGKVWGEWDDKDIQQFGVASQLGDEGREKIKGNSLNYYLDQLHTVRETTLQKFKERDDDWLLSVDEDWYWGPTNNYCKWFHVCEHESNHHGQIKYIMGRVPSDG